MALQPQEHLPPVSQDAALDYLDEHGIDIVLHPEVTVGVTPTIDELLLISSSSSSSIPGYCILLVFLC